MDDGAIDEADEEADTSRANLSPRDSYCDCRSRMKLGGPGGSPPMMRSEEDSPAVPPDVVEYVGCPPDDDEFVVWDMLRDGRFRLAPMRALAARSAADGMILCMRRMFVCLCVCVCVSLALRTLLRCPLSRRCSAAAFPFLLLLSPNRVGNKEKLI